MKENVEVIHFHIKSWGVLGLVFVQIMFENCTLNFFFGNSEIGKKKDDCHIAALISIERFRVFKHFHAATF